jgi:hypothetical protein
MSDREESSNRVFGASNRLLTNMGHESNFFKAEVVRQIANYHAEVLGDSDVTIQQLRRNAVSLEAFGYLDDERAWTKYRNQKPWYLRWNISKQVPDWFKIDYQSGERERAQRAVSEALGRGTDA